MSNFLSRVFSSEECLAAVASPAVEVADVCDIAHIKIATSSTTTIIAPFTSSGGGSSDISIQRIKSFSQSAIYVEPPVTDEVLLVEKGAVGTEEAVLDEPRVAVICTDVESLAVRLGVSIVPFDLGVAEEGGLWRVNKDGVVLAGDTRNILGESLKW
jgi:hypothetical protein